MLRQCSNGSSSGRIAHHTCKACRQGEEQEVAVRQGGVGAVLALLQGAAASSTWAGGEHG